MEEIKVGSHVQFRTKRLHGVIGKVHAIFDSLTSDPLARVEWEDGLGGLFKISSLILIHVIPSIREVKFKVGAKITCNGREGTWIDGLKNKVGRVVGGGINGKNNVLVDFDEMGRWWVDLDGLTLVEDPPEETYQFKCGDCVKLKGGSRITGKVMGLNDCGPTVKWPNGTESLCPSSLLTLVIISKFNVGDAVMTHNGYTGKVVRVYVSFDNHAVKYLVRWDWSGKEGWRNEDTISQSNRFSLHSIVPIFGQIVQHANGKFGRIKSHRRVPQLGCENGKVQYQVYWPRLAETSWWDPDDLKSAHEWKHKRMFILCDRVSDWRGNLGTIVRINNPSQTTTQDNSDQILTVLWDDGTKNLIAPWHIQLTSLPSKGDNMNPKDTDSSSSNSTTPTAHLVYGNGKSYFFLTEAAARVFAEKQTAETGVDHLLFEKKAKCSPHRNVAWE